MTCTRCQGTGKPLARSDRGIVHVPITCSACNGTGTIVLLSKSDMPGEVDILDVPAFNANVVQDN